jgi:hypothetical protein
MSGAWEYQIRLYLGDAFAQAVRERSEAPEVARLMAILAQHDATLRNTHDSFVEYVREAERAGPEGFALYKWTKATIEDPEKRARHLKSFSVRVGDREVYPAEVADALEVALAPLVDGARIERLLKNDTNPANNIPIPPDMR